MMLLWTILEGCGLGMLHLYHADVQARCVELGLTMPERIRRNSLHFKLCCLPLYLAYTLGFVYAVNGARGFWEGVWQLLGMLSVLNLIDRIGIDEWWVGHTDAWTIPGREDLKPYITAEDRRKKMAVRNGRHGGDFGCAGWDDGNFREMKVKVYAV